MTLGGFVTIVISFFREIRLKVPLVDVAHGFFASFAIFAVEDLGSVGKGKAFTAKGRKNSKQDKYREGREEFRTRVLMGLPEEDKLFRPWLEG